MRCSIQIAVLLAVVGGCRRSSDSDGDGWADDDDCRPSDLTVHPGATERCNGIDDDCDGDVDGEAVDAAPWFVDADGDGHGAGAAVRSCDQPADHVGTGDDCDDAHAEVYPGASEVYGDGFDNDCVDDGLPHAPRGEVRLDSGAALVTPSPPGECRLPLLDLDGDGHLDLLCGGRNGPVFIGGPLLPAPKDPVPLRADLVDVADAWVWPVVTPGGQAILVGRHWSQPDHEVDGYPVPSTVPLRPAAWSMLPNPGSRISGYRRMPIGAKAAPGLILTRRVAEPEIHDVTELVALPMDEVGSYAHSSLVVARYDWSPDQTCVGAVPVGDLDGGGEADVVCPNSEVNVLSTEDNLVEFTAPFERRPLVAGGAADVDGDGKDDLVLYSYGAAEGVDISRPGLWMMPGPIGGRASVRLGTEGLQGVPLVLDFDGDGNSDIGMAHLRQDDAAVLLLWRGPRSEVANAENASLTLIVEEGADRIVNCSGQTADLDEDGHPDLLLSCFDDNGIIHVLPGDWP